MSTDSSSDECCGLARSWLENCKQNHPECLPGPLPPLPTRVIFVGSSEKDLRLHVTENEKARYTALSHCWGKAVMPMLTTCCLDLMKESIPLSCLPKTFRDAIHITRKLGVSYLWIDSLCILQNSSVDWANESAQMDSIYTKAWVTIAADGAPDSRGGCFVGPHDRVKELARIECPGPNGFPSHIYVRQGAHRPGNTFVAHTTSEVPTSSLDGRAWVLQERMLSPRTLLYTSAELAFECYTETRCECEVKALTPYMNSYKKAFVENTVMGRVDFSSHHHDWKITLMDYTRRRLTKDRDRLPAISGIAAAFHRATLATYAFGLWREDFLAGLLWLSRPDTRSTKCSQDEFDEERSVSRRHQTYHAPSWSWASVMGPVNMYTTEISQPMVPRLQYLHCVPATSNPYGPAREAWVKIVGPVAEIRLHIPGNTWMDTIRQTQRLHFRAYSASVLVDGSYVSGFVEPDVKGEGYEIDVDEPHFLLLVTRFSTAPWPAGLILRKAKRDRLAFERVGLLSGDKNRETWEEWLSIATQQTLTIV